MSTMNGDATVYRSLRFQRCNSNSPRLLLIKMKSRIPFFLFFLVSLSITCTAQRVKLLFEITFKDEKVGELIATKDDVVVKSINNLHTKMDTKFLLLSIHMESEVVTTEENGILIEGTAYRDANRLLHEIHASVRRIGPHKYRRERNGKTKTITGDITFCVTDLYFHEPKGLSSVFSNMYADFLKIQKVGDSQYRVMAGDNNDSFFTYKDGILESVEVDTALGKILSHRR